MNYHTLIIPADRNNTSNSPLYFFQSVVKRNEKIVARLATKPNQVKRARETAATPKPKLKSKL